MPQSARSPNRPATVSSPDSLTITPGETRKLSGDFANFGEVKNNGETLASGAAVTATPSGLTIGTASISGTKVQASISGGTDGTTYRLVFSAVTDASHTLELPCNLVCTDGEI